MDYSYGVTLHELPFSAYETVLVDAMEGDMTLFTRGDQAEEAWRIVGPVLEAWAKRPARDISIYEAGSWGPEAADALIARSGHSWRRPAKGRRDMSIEILPDGDALALRTADLFAMAAQEAAAARGRFAVALSGGETPRALYRLLARQQFSQKVPWRRVQLYWGDERCVPPDDPQSNYGDGARLVHQARADRRRQRAPDARRGRAGGGRAGVRRRAARPGRPGAAAGRRARLRPRPARPRRPTATRPRSSRTATRWRSRTASASRPRRPTARRRLTVTAPVLNAARRVWFLVSGAKKAGMVAEVLEGLRVPNAVPAQGVAPVHGALTWFLDEAAAAELSPDARA